MSEITMLLGSLVTKRKSEINAWFAGARTNTPPFFYCSVDIRHSGKKMAPVDTNLFPAGFNNLSKNGMQSAIEETKKYFAKYHPNTDKILIVPENHTRNLFYLENVHVLESIIREAGFDVILGSLEAKEVTTIESKNGHKVILHPIKKEDCLLKVGDTYFIPDVIVVNNDLTSGAPALLKDLRQKVVPPVGFGWYRRRKSIHFDSYANIANEFSHGFGLDPWLISAAFQHCGKINFKEMTGLECVAMNVEKVIHKISRKYEEYGIKDKPYVFVKADSGTYGMGIMTVYSGEEIMDLNKKDRNKMNVIKEGTMNTEVIIQEGVPTIDEVDGKAAEPMMYMIGGNPVGCSYRVNSSRDNYGNLNSPGVEFKNVCEEDEEVSGTSALCPVQSLIARLAELAAARECYEPGWEI